MGRQQTVYTYNQKETSFLKEESKDFNLFNKIAKKELKKLRKTNFQNLKKQVFEIDSRTNSIYIHSKS